MPIRLAFPRLAALVPLVLFGPIAPSALGQTEPEAEIEEVVVVGSRAQQARSPADLPVPVDVIGGDEFLSHGSTDMDSLLSALVPSYNVSQEPISDAATFIRPAQLRALPPDATLVLVNGKRRHRAAVIALLGSGVAGGAQGPDLSVIPAIALDRLEVLRDGASAQYGSDAIAGVMNFVLREDRDGLAVDLKWGNHYEGDGDALTIASNLGLPLTDAGFANFSFEFKQSDPTSRSVQRGDAQALIDAGNAAVRQPAAQIWGAPEISDDYKLFGNFGLELGNGSEAYAFGNWAKRQVEGGFFYRNPHTRGGVFRGPVLEDGTPTVKVADLTGDMSGNCPVVRIMNNRPDSAALEAIRSNPDCYSLIEKFPGGFTPQFGGYVRDASLAGGLRGELPAGWFYDLSASVGRSNAEFYIYNTINPQLLSMGNDIPIHYDAGAYTETDRVVNLDLSKPMDLGLYSDVNFAFGLEYRDETFKIENGEPNSFFIDPNLAAQGFGIGSNGFPGFPPGDAGSNTVRAYGAYLDLESDLSERLLLGAALRYENYPEFGDTLDGKVSARLQLADNFAVRGAASTGFRVPTAGQANLRNVTTEFQAGMLADIATLPPTNPVAQQKGAVPLTPEQSRNLTFGVLLSLGALDLTLDYYNIRVEDRISFTSRFNLTQADIDALLAAGVADATSFASVRFFSNQQTVQASGIDLVATLPFDLAGGASDLTLAANFSNLDLAEYNPDFTSENRKQQIERGRPDSRFTLTWRHLQGPWQFLARARYYGEYYDATTNDASVAYFPNAELLFDIEGGLRLGDAMTLRAGAQNLFDTYPQKNPNGEVAGLIYPEASPFGFNGGFYYLRATWEWLR